MMGTPHKHAEVIKAWADGADIQYQFKNDTEWLDVGSGTKPSWIEERNYRIKHQPKHDIIRYFGIDNWTGSNEDMSGFNDSNLSIYSNWDNKIKITFDGETNKLKAVEIVK